MNCAIVSTIGRAKESERGLVPGQWRSGLTTTPFSSLPGGFDEFLCYRDTRREVATRCPYRRYCLVYRSNGKQHFREIESCVD